MNRLTWYQVQMYCRDKKHLNNSQSGLTHHEAIEFGKRRQSEIRDFADQIIQRATERCRRFRDHESS